MKNEANNFPTKIATITVIIMIIAYVGLFFSGFIFTNANRNEIVSICGWILWAGGFILALSPNVVLKKRGGVPDGKSYVNTTILVKDGIYSIIRHPQYTGGIIICMSVVLIIQSYFALMLGVIAIGTSYYSMVLEELNLVEKFGEDYVKYKEETPRANIVLGIIKKIKENA